MQLILNFTLRPQSTLQFFKRTFLSFFEKGIVQGYTEENKKQKAKGQNIEAIF